MDLNGPVGRKIGRQVPPDRHERALTLAAERLLAKAGWRRERLAELTPPTSATAWDKDRKVRYEGRIAPPALPTAAGLATTLGYQGLDGLQRFFNLAMQRAHAMLDEREAGPPA